MSLYFLVGNQGSANMGRLLSFLLIVAVRPAHRGVETGAGAASCWNQAWAPVVGMVPPPLFGRVRALF